MVLLRSWLRAGGFDSNASVDLTVLHCFRASPEKRPELSTAFPAYALTQPDVRA